MFVALIVLLVISFIVETKLIGQIRSTELRLASISKRSDRYDDPSLHAFRKYIRDVDYEYFRDTEVVANNSIFPLFKRGMVGLPRDSDHQSNTGLGVLRSVYLADLYVLWRTKYWPLGSVFNYSYIALQVFFALTLGAFVWMQDPKLLLSCGVLAFVIAAYKAVWSWIGMHTYDRVSTWMRIHSPEMADSPYLKLRASLSLVDAIQYVLIGSFVFFW